MRNFVGFARGWAFYIKPALLARTNVGCLFGLLVLQAGHLCPAYLNKKPGITARPIDWD
jgi:hypothetical protein